MTSRWTSDRLRHGRLRKRHIQRVNELGETVLFQAVKKGSLKLVQKLINLGADLKHRNFNGQTVLHVASVRGHVDIVDYLIGIGISLSDEDISGNTAIAAPLHCAAGWLDIQTFPSQLADKHKTVVLHLLEAGMNVNCRDVAGESVLQTAIRIHGIILNDYYIPSLLVQHGSDVNCAGCHKSRRSRQSPLSLACSQTSSVFHFSPDFVLLLLEAGARVEPWLQDVCMKDECDIPAHLQAISQHILYQATHVPSLQQHCRLLLRTLLHPRLQWKIDKLPISNSLKSFLKLINQ